MKGVLPSSIWNMITPRDHKSLAYETFVSSIVSGAMYSSVPTRL